MNTGNRWLPAVRGAGQDLLHDLIQIAQRLAAVPDDRELVQVGTTYFWQLDPPPDPSVWSQLADPEERLQAALAELYTSYRRNRALFANIERDLPLIMEQFGGVPPAG
ncbi:MAG: hypothetical protein AB7K36_15420 [Chloroflexota bacterium]